MNKLSLTYIAYNKQDVPYKNAETRSTGNALCMIEEQDS